MEDSRLNEKDSRDSTNYHSDGGRDSTPVNLSINKVLSWPKVIEEINVHRDWPGLPSLRC